MNRMSPVIFRVCFFVMLFVSTACNKLDRSLLKDELSEARSAAASAQADESARVRELEGRVLLLEAELKALNTGADAAAGVPGGMNWD